MVFGQIRRDFHHVGQRVAGFQCRDNAFAFTAELERFQRFDVGDGHVFCPPDFMQPRVFWPYAGIVQARRNAEPFQNLPVVVLQQIRPVAVQHAGATTCQRRAVFHLGVHTFAARFHADDVNRPIVQKREEQPHRVRPTADCGNDRVGQTPFGGLHLFFGLFADDGLEIAHHGGVRVRACDGADAVKRIAHVGDPITQGVVHGVFQCAAATGDRHHFGPQQFHAEHVGRLAFHVVGPHVHHAFQTELGTNGRRCHAVLARAGLRDDAGFAHATGQDDLAQNVVDFVGAGVVQLIPFQVNLRPPQAFSHAFRKVQRRRATHIVGPQIVHFRPKRFVRFGVFVLRFQIQDQRHQGFGHKPPTKVAETPGVVRTRGEGIQAIIRHSCPQFCSMLSSSLVNVAPRNKAFCRVRLKRCGLLRRTLVSWRGL